MIPQVLRMLKWWVSALRFVDLYELTMAASYYAHQVFSTATFSLFIRDNHLTRNYFVVAGLEDALNELAGFHFSEQDIQYFKTTDLFSHDFISYLAQLRFSGDVRAMPEGTIFFTNEPVLEVTAPIIEAQLIETFMLNTIGFQTMVGVSADAPYVDVVYKMIRFKDRDVRKLSSGKITLAGEKQVFRKSDQNGRYLKDIIGLKDEAVLETEPLLEKVMEDGKLLRPNPSLQAVRDRFKKKFSQLDEKYKSIHNIVTYSVKLSRGLQELQERL